MSAANSNYTQFIIDPQTMSYTTNVNKKEIIKDHIKDLAIKKLKVYKKDKDILNEEEEEEEGEYSEDSEEENESDSSLSFTTIQQQSQDKLRKVISGDLDINNKGSKAGNDTYYKVNFTNIKYLQYHYEKNSFIEKLNYLKMTKVDMIMKGIIEDNDDGEQKIKLDHKNSVTAPSVTNNNIGTINQTSYLNSKTTIELIHKQIEERLSKKEVQTSVIYLKFTSLFIILTVCVTNSSTFLFNYKFL